MKTLIYTTSFVKTIWIIEQILCKDAASIIVYKTQGKILDSYYLAGIWKTFGSMKKFLCSCEDSINIELKLIKFLHDSLKLKECKVESFVKYFDELVLSDKQCREQVEVIIKDLLLGNVGNDLWTHFIEFSKDFNNHFSNEYLEFIKKKTGY